MRRPEVKYVTVGDAQVAYQVVGEGPVDLAFCASLGAQVDQWWHIPAAADYLNSLAAVTRLILFDRRGSGASDRLPSAAVLTWESFAEDLTAVLDAVGSTETAVLGAIETGPIAILFAAMHPERVRSLVLGNTGARFSSAPDYPEGLAPEAIDAIVELLAQTWGTEDAARMIVPSRADDHDFTGAMAAMNRASATPNTAAAQFDYLLRNIDVRSVLHLIRAPTFVAHVVDSPLLPVELGRYLAEHIAGARLLEVPGADLVLGATWDAMNADVIEFITGERPEGEIDRLLTTVLFTDIVSSTEQAASLGDRRWHALLDTHDRAVREQVARFRGKEVKTTGDGFLVSFDGPARAIRCAQGIIEATRGVGVDLRIGLHTGECEVRGDDLGGLAVHIAARIGATADSREILVSSALKDLVIGSGIEFTERGEFDLKGVPGIWKLFTVAT